MICCSLTHFIGAIGHPLTFISNQKTLNKNTFNYFQKFSLPASSPHLFHPPTPSPR